MQFTSTIRDDHILSMSLSGKLTYQDYNEVKPLLKHIAGNHVAKVILITHFPQPPAYGTKEEQ